MATEPAWPSDADARPRPSALSAAAWFVAAVVGSAALGLLGGLIWGEAAPRALLQEIRQLARKMEFLEAGQDPGQKMDAALLRMEIDRLFVLWGLRAISGLELDGEPASPATLAETGPEELFHEALAIVRAQTGLSTAERKN